MIGAGGIARAHAGGIAKSGNARLVAVYDPASTGASLAADHGARAAAEAAEVVNSGDVDAIVIASPTDCHAEHLRLAHAAGKPVLCEKPLVRSEDEAAEIARLFDGYPAPAWVGHVLRFSPEYIHLKGLADAGTLGNIGTVRLHRGCDCPPPGDNWRRDFARCGGVVMDLGLHDLDFVEWAFGPIERVFCMKSGPDAEGRHEYALVVARLKSGAIAHFEMSWNEPPGVFYYGYEVAGSGGLAEFDSRSEPTLLLRGKNAADSNRVMNPMAVAPHDAQMAAFLKAVEGADVNGPRIADGLRAVRLSLAVLRSAETGAPVTL
jgi:predicted dehydrogenase